MSLEPQWKDQPEILQQAECVFPYIYLGDGRTIQIFRDSRWYYFTVGNLFGSQTIRAHNLKTIGLIIRAIQLDPKEQPEIDLRNYADAEIMENL